MSDPSLFKYLNELHAHSFLERGEMLFSNLTRFKQMEHHARGDVMEGCHVDNPDNDITIHNKTTGRSFSGPFSFRNSVNDEKVFVFCLATALRKELFVTFDASHCVQVLDTGAFFSRCMRAIKRLNFIDSVGLMHGDVTYYKPNEACAIDVTDGRNIPFLKHADFADQHEYRLAFARKGALRTIKRIIIDRNWDTEPDHQKGEARTLRLLAGPMRDICRLHRIDG